MLVDLRDALRVTASDLGIDLFGVADLSSVKDFVTRQGGSHVGGFPRAVSLGLRLVDDVIDELHNHQDLAVLSTYRVLYNTVNNTLDHATLMVAKKIQDAGYRAYPVPASSVLKDDRLVGAFSHKLAANLSGLGWIGRSCLLITPDHGPRLRLATVLTDAPLEAGSPIPNGCGTCKSCVEVCPAKAFTGRAFDPSEPREARFEARKCNDYTEGRVEVFGNVNCGLCVHVCPFGRKRSTRKD